MYELIEDAIKEETKVSENLVSLQRCVCQDIVLTCVAIHMRVVKV